MESQCQFKTPRREVEVTRPARLIRRELTERYDHLWRRATDLLTFWPPGPLDRLKDTTPIRRGIVLESKVASHSLAARRCSSSDCWPGVGCPAVDVDNRMRNGDHRLMGRNPRDIIVNGAAIIIAVVLSWSLDVDASQ